MKIKPEARLTFGGLIVAALHGGKNINKSNEPVGRVKIALAVALLTVSTGCVGVVGDGGYYGGDGVVGGPDVYLFGGGYDRGRDMHAFSQRGSASRGVAHPSGGGHASGGGAHGGGGGKR